MAPAPAAALPAPLWRRLIAAIYDSLLLIGLWMVALLADVLIRDAFEAPRNWIALRTYLFAVGLVFFGWFWTHGGQTLGMRVWRLRVQRDDGRPLDWLSAAVRYGAMLAVWGAVLAPFLLRLPKVRDEPYAGVAALVCAVLALLGMAAMLIDRKRRAPQDWLGGATVVVLPPKAPKT
ncbi:MAG: RDD family protein [Solimonas sp.]